MAGWSVTIKKEGRTWHVYGNEADGTTVKLEGGFFTREAAEESRLEWERERLNEEVRIAERKAGWDPNP